LTASIKSSEIQQKNSVSLKQFKSFIELCQVTFPQNLLMNILKFVYEFFRQRRDYFVGKPLLFCQ